MAKGLSHRFSVQNGSLQLSFGAAKAKDKVHFLMIFDSVARIYLPDFNPKLLWLIQKTTSFVNTRKPLILGRLKRLILTFVPDVKVDNITMVSHRPVGDLTYEIFVDYTYIGTDVGQPVTDTTVRFI